MLLPQIRSLLGSSPFLSIVSYWGLRNTERLSLCCWWFSTWLIQPLNETAASSNSCVLEAGSYLISSPVVVFLDIRNIWSTLTSSRLSFELSSSRTSGSSSKSTLLTRTTSFICFEERRSVEGSDLGSYPIDVRLQESSVCVGDLSSVRRGCSLRLLPELSLLHLFPPLSGCYCWLFVGCAMLSCPLVIRTQTTLASEVLGSGVSTWWWGKLLPVIS